MTRFLLWTRTSSPPRRLDHGRQEHVSRQQDSRRRSNVSFTSPTTVYAALFTTAPTASYTNTAATGTEVVDTNYTRVAATFSAPSGGSTSNSGTLNFFGAGAAGPGPYSIVAVGILDLGGAPITSPFGNLLYFGNLTVAKSVSTGDTLQFAATALAVSES